MLRTVPGWSRSCCPDSHDPSSSPYTNTILLPCTMRASKRDQITTTGVTQAHRPRLLPLGPFGVALDMRREILACPQIEGRTCAEEKACEEVGGRRRPELVHDARGRERQENETDRRQYPSAPRLPASLESLLF